MTRANARLKANHENECTNVSSLPVPEAFHVIHKTYMPSCQPKFGPNTKKKIQSINVTSTRTEYVMTLIDSRASAGGRPCFTNHATMLRWFLHTFHFSLIVYFSPKHFRENSADESIQFLNVPWVCVCVFVSKATSVKSSRYPLLCRYHTKEALQRSYIHCCAVASADVCYFSRNLHSDYTSTNMNVEAPVKLQSKAVRVPQLI